MLILFWPQDYRKHLEPPGNQFHHGFIHRDRSCHEQQRRRESREHSRRRWLLDVRYVTGRFGVYC